MRKTQEELEKIKQEYNVDTIWSWSRYNTYKNDPYIYYLKYIKRIKEDRNDSIYAVSGGFAHDILEKYYNGTIAQKEMIDEYNDAIFTMQISDLKYDRNDSEKNRSIADKYEACMKHFFINHTKPIDRDIFLEDYCLIKITNDIIFNGYIDNYIVYKDEQGQTRVIITDYKTSTIYKGDKLQKESGQLYIYAEGIRQKFNIPLENITIRYLFMKYVNVNCQQVNGKWKERQIERNQIGSKLASSVRVWLKKLGYNADDFIDDVILYNSLDNLPEDVKNKFVISDCYVELPLSEEVVDNLKADIIDTISEINSKTKEYESNHSDKPFWYEVTDKNEYFLAVLSGYSRYWHKPYDEYLKNKELFEEKQEDDDQDLMNFLAEL